MSNKKIRFENAAKALRIASREIGEIHHADLGISNHEQMNEVREDMQGLATNLERWAEDVEEGEE